MAAAAGDPGVEQPAVRGVSQYQYRFAFNPRATASGG
jgi:hypothetical protein